MNFETCGYTISACFTIDIIDEDVVSDIPKTYWYKTLED